jgi:hypothetical protein
MFKVVDKNGMVVKRIKATKTKLSTLHQNNEKDVFRASQELAGVPPITGSKV